MKASDLKFKEVQVNGYTCPEGYPSDCLRHAGEKKTSANVGMWPANVYNIGADEILAFIHLEFRHHDNWNIRHGLAYSKDGGENFQWLDYILGPNREPGESVKGESLSPNMGLSNYIIKDGYFQVYYHDTIEPGKYGPTGPSQQV